MAFNRLSPVCNICIRTYSYSFLFFFFKGLLHHPAELRFISVNYRVIYFDKQNGSLSRIPSIALAIPKSVSFMTGGRSPDGLSAKSKFSGFRS